MDKKLQKIIKIVLVIIGCYFIYLLFPGLKSVFRLIITVILPFLIGFTGAYILLPIVDALVKWRFNRKAAVVFVVSVFIVIILTLGIILVPRIFKQFMVLTENVPTYVSNMADFLNRISERLSFLPDEIKPTPSNVQVFLLSKVDLIFDSLTIVIKNSISYLLIVIIAPILMIYFMIDYPNIKTFIQKILVQKEKYDWFLILHEINESMRSYFQGGVIVMTIMTLSSTFCFLIIGIELPLLWGFMIGITNIIPYIGPYLGGGIVGLFTLSTEPSKVLPIVIVVVVLQIIESNFVTPNIQSKSVQSNPLLILLSLAFFGELFGLLGMICAVPALSVIQIIVKKKILSKKS